MYFDKEDPWCIAGVFLGTVLSTAADLVVILALVYLLYR